MSTTKAVRYTQMILGTSAAGELVAVPGATVTIRRDGVATEVYASATRSPLANPLPVGVADGQPGVDMQGNLTVYLDPDDNYDAVVTVGTASTTIVLPDISPDAEDVEAPIPPGTYVPTAETAPDWAVRTKYAVGDRAVYNGTLYRAIVAHTTGTTRASWNAANWAATGDPVFDDARNIHLRGTAEGGTTAFDSTPHITLESYQDLQAGFGEVLRIMAMGKNSYQHIAWYFATDPNLPPHPDTNPLKQGVWMGAHYGNQFAGDPHGHWSLEVPGTDGQLRTRFEVEWCKQSAPFSPGVDKTNVGFHHADLTLTCFAENDTSGRAPVFRFAGASNEQAVEWNKGAGGDEPAKRRWHLLCDVAAESGADAGSNFALRRFDDLGATVTTAMYVRRSNGNVTFGEAADQNSRVAARWPGAAAHGFFAAPTASPNSGFAAFAASMPAAGDRYLQAIVVGDANARFTSNMNGKLEWGPATTARDTVLERKVAGVLGLGATHAFRTGVVATGSRPNPTTVGQGSGIFDSTLNKPIWSTGSAWVDASGAAV